MICVLGGLEELDGYAIGGDTVFSVTPRAWSRSQYTTWPGFPSTLTVTLTLARELLEFLPPPLVAVVLV
jgi:hypothetical protein